MFSFAVTDLSNNFDFDFTTLNRKALYESYLFNLPVFIFPKVFFSGVDLKHGFILIKIEIWDNLFKALYFLN